MQRRDETLGSNGSTNGAAIEKRRYPRRNIALDVSIGPTTSQTASPERELEHTVTVNISAGGVCLYTNHLHPFGTPLACAITVPGRPKPIDAVATVAWFQQISQGAHGYKMGLEFLQIAEEDRARLSRLVLEPASRSTTRTQKLLVVDDDVEFNQALKERLESVGFQVLTAKEGLEALTKSRAEHPDLIILDLMLPKLSGYEVCRLLKFDPQFRHIPVILCTARSRQEDRELGYAVGADAYVTKPFAGNLLLTKVDELLAKSQGAS